MESKLLTKKYFLYATEFFAGMLQIAAYYGQFCGAKRPQCGAERPGSLLI